MDKELVTKIQLLILQHLNHQEVVDVELTQFELVVTGKYRGTNCKYLKGVVQKL